MLEEWSLRQCSPGPEGEGIRRRGSGGGDQEEGIRRRGSGGGDKEEDKEEEGGDERIRTSYTILGDNAA